MRGFWFGVLLGSFGAMWALNALPQPIDHFLDAQVCKGAEAAGLDLCTEDESDHTTSEIDDASDDGDVNVATDPSPSISDEDDALRRGGVFRDGHLVEVYTCPGMTIAHEPPTDASGRITSFKPKISVESVSLSLAPVSHACFSSGFGERNGRQHKGIDYHSEARSVIYAAGSGTIVEVAVRADFGNMIVIDHGNGVYTRYAHLKSFAAGTKEGLSVTDRTELGLMGKTATGVIHLHYEVLLGDYNTPAKSFGLQAVDPMSY